MQVLRSDWQSQQEAAAAIARSCPRDNAKNSSAVTITQDAAGQDDVVGSKLCAKKSGVKGIFILLTNHIT